MMHRLQLAVCLVMLPLVSLAEEIGELPRWALIATDELNENGLLDLLTVELSREQSPVQLVERDRLNAAMRELELSSLVDSSSIADRLQLGKILKADALMVFSLERNRHDTQLRIVVCDCDLGVRLWKGDFRCDPEPDVLSLCKNCVEIVNEVRLRFAGGIQQIVAVPPFLSENFEQHFDFLQTRFRDLLVSSLVAKPGIAIVEIDEAHAVLKELEQTLSPGIDRPITVFVKGTYQVGDVDGENNRSVEINIEISRGNTPTQLQNTCTISDAGVWLTDVLPKKLLDEIDHANSLTAKSQFEILIRHAQRFSELGNWEQATTLREAALVLDPKNSLQRGLLIHDYQNRMHREFLINQHPARFAKPLPIGPRENSLRLAAEDYQAGLEHLAYLVRMRLIGHVDAIGLLGKHAWHTPLIAYFGPALPRDPIIYDAFQPAWTAQRKFIRETYPLIAALPQGRSLPKFLSEPYYNDHYVVSCHVANDVSFNGYGKESLASLRDVLLKFLPAGDKSTYPIVNLLMNASHSDGANFKVWNQLVNDLCHSDRELTRLYGRLARARSAAAMEELILQLNEHERTDEPIFHAVNARLGRFENTKPLVATATPPQGKLGPFGRMSLESISLTVTGEDANEPPLIAGLVRCGDMDACWSKDKFFLMQQPGMLQEVRLTDISADHHLFWEVAWDGELIWLHAHGQGILAIRPDGNIVARFKNIIPGYWNGHRLLALSPRKVLMVGSFGETQRAWCGLLEIDATGEPSVNLIFEAKRVREGRTLQEANSDAETVFRPGNISVLQNRNGHNFALVDRVELSPLLIDLGSLRVSVWTRDQSVDLTTQTEFGFKGKWFFQNGARIFPVSGLATDTSHSDRMVYYNSWLYRPGTLWIREHVESRTLEHLQAKSLASKHWNMQLDESAHFGLVAYDPHFGQPRLSRVKILAQTE